MADPRRSQERAELVQMVSSGSSQRRCAASRKSCGTRLSVTWRPLRIWQLCSGPGQHRHRNAHWCILTVGKQWWSHVGHLSSQGGRGVRKFAPARGGEAVEELLLLDVDEVREGPCLLVVEEPLREELLQPGEVEVPMPAEPA